MTALTDPPDLPSADWCAGVGHAPHVVQAAELEQHDGVQLCAVCRRRAAGSPDGAGGHPSDGLGGGAP